MRGNCFMVAVDVAETVGDGGRIVHGLPIGRGPENLGRRYWHAWVELDVFDGLVIDYSNGQRLVATRGTYYERGELDEWHVFRYDLQDARTLMLEHGHYGPWVAGWESMGEV